MTTLFISDLHLDDARPHILELFEEFLDKQARNAESLYILGDLFEAWVGDDDDSALARRVTGALHELSAGGVPVYVMRGNRDFLFGPRFEERSGCRLLPDPTAIQLNGERVLLMHGDTLCTDDTEYQNWRARVRTESWQREFLSLALEQRRRFAADARKASQAHTASSAETIMDVNPDTVLDAMREHHVQRLIHGHTHRPAIHDFELDGKPAHRIVLGDWYEQGSVLRYDEDSFKLAAL